MKQKMEKTVNILLMLIVMFATVKVVTEVVMTVVPMAAAVAVVVTITIVYYKTIYKDMKLAKLATLRQLFIGVLTIAEITIKTIKQDSKIKAYYYPIKWLNHFLKGSGESMEVPQELVNQAEPALMKAIEHDDYGTIANTGNIKGKFCVNHSTLYDGKGFYGRPSLFYVMGGFTFRCYESNGKYIVSGNDYYDWHSDGNENYFTSPLGKSKTMEYIVALLGKIFGDDLFVTKGWPSEQPGISNKLWEEMYLVGANSFHSFFKNIVVNFSEEDIMWAINNNYDDEDYDEDYDEYNNENEDCEEENSEELLYHIMSSYLKWRTFDYHTFMDYIEYLNKYCTYEYGEITASGKDLATVIKDALEQDVHQRSVYNDEQLIAQIKFEIEKEDLKLTIQDFDVMVQVVKAMTSPFVK